MWTVFKKREFMTDLFYKFICLLALCFILISCWSSPSGSNSSQQSVSQQPVERQLKRYTTYQTSLTNEDIMRSFVNEVRTYLQRYDSYFYIYYLVGSNVFSKKEMQNYAWMTSTHENVYEWGTVYTIRLVISNAELWVKFSNASFTYNGQSSQGVGTTRSNTELGNRIRKNIVDTATSMYDESEMVLKMNNMNYSDDSKTIFLDEIIRIMQ